ncbi:MAG: hypothetical protein QXU97_03450 [Fervidicoccaceae archaeon]
MSGSRAAPCSIAVYRGGPTGECLEPPGEIDVFELAYATKKGKTEARGSDGNKIDWIDVIRIYSSEEPRAWVMFSVYYDLIERGRLVKRGPLPHGFTMYSGGKPLANIVVLEETVPLVVNSLIEWLQTSRKQGRALILAIVDKHGDVSYYQLEGFE